MRDKIKAALEKTSTEDLVNMIVNDIRIIDVVEPPQGKLEGIWIDINFISSEMPSEDLKKIRDLIGHERRTNHRIPSRYYCKSCNKTLESRENEIKLCECLKII